MKTAEDLTRALEAIGLRTGNEGSTRDFIIREVDGIAHALMVDEHATTTIGEHAQDLANQGLTVILWGPDIRPVVVAVNTLANDSHEVTRYGFSS